MTPVIMLVYLMVLVPVLVVLVALELCGSTARTFPIGEAPTPPPPPPKSVSTNKNIG